MDFQAASATSSPRGRRQSRSSFNEPSTPTHHLHPSFSNGDGIDVFSSGGVDGAVAGGGLGNLADELADAYSDDEEGDEYYDDEEEQRLQQQFGTGGQGAPDISLSEADEDGGDSTPQQRDSGVDVAPGSSPRSGSGPDRPRERNASLSLPTANGGAGHGGRRGGGGGGHKRVGSAYDGSEYGSDSDLDSPGMPTSLVAKIDAVESLARRGIEDNGSATDGVCKRLTEGLRDLGSQAAVEGGASRYSLPPSLSSLCLSLMLLSPLI